MGIRQLTEDDANSVFTVVLLAVMMCAPAGLGFGIYRWWNTVIPPNAPQNAAEGVFFQNILGLTVLGAICGVGVGLVAFAILFILGGILRRLKSIRRFFSFYSVEEKLANDIVLALKYLDQYDNAKSDKKAEKIGQLRECLERAYTTYDPSFDAVR